MAYKGLTEDQYNFLVKIGQITDQSAAVKKPAAKKDEDNE
jgi:hypothetical protein